MSRAADRLDLLKTFVRVVDAGSLSAAARQLRVSQPSVSRQVQQLERLVGARLLERTTHALSITGAGSVLLPQARSVIDGWDALADSVTGDASEVRGRLRVVVPVGMGQTLLVPMVARLREAHAALSFEWIVTDQAIRVADLGIDCLVRVGPVDDAALVARTVAVVERILVAAPVRLGIEKITQPGHLSRVPVVVVSPYATREVVLLRGGREARVEVEPVFRTDNVLAAKAAAISGMGVAVLPTWMVQEDIKSKRLVRVLPAWVAPPLHVSVAWPSSGYRPKRVQALVELLTSELVKIPGVAAPGMPDQRSGR
jgi:molybdate transport repressor ModE-like protein